MKNVNGLLKKKYNKKLEKLSAYKTKLATMQKLFKEYGITCMVKDEFSFYQIEIIYESILNKQKFEETYLSTYVSMHDFWQDLDYQERKHQMNVDIKQMRLELKSFPYEGEEIYIPMFDMRMNRLYTEEIVLLELKQYGRFVHSFEDSIKKNLYGIYPYMYNFSSCLFIAGDDSYFAIYNPDLNRLYFIKDYVCVDSLNFDPCKSDNTCFEEMQNLSELYMLKQEEELTKAIISYDLIDSKMKSKLEKYCEKVGKKQG